MVFKFSGRCCPTNFIAAAPAPLPHTDHGHYRWAVPTSCGGLSCGGLTGRAGRLWPVGRALANACEQRLERCLRGLPGVSCSCCLSRRERGDETGTQRAASVSQSSVTRAAGKARSVGAARQAGIADRHSRILTYVCSPQRVFVTYVFVLYSDTCFFPVNLLIFSFNYRRRRKLLVSGA
uniref:Uncharacterized protein n=1 Tax=Rousettus aegyptiacus TaxID=9407 RepID=A0A7J8HQZ1_ROUAE|nr:hypothetical protein HJG63_010883 [Rousettus aegyptiacus]